MKNSLKLVRLSDALLVTLALTIVAATPAEEKAFTDKFKAAMEGNDTTTLEGFLYTEGSDRHALEIYKMMLQRETELLRQFGNAGGQFTTNIELVSLTPEDVKKAMTPEEGPTGKYCLNLTPTKKLVIKLEHKDAISSGSSTSEYFVAEKEGKLVISVHGPCK